MSDGMVRILYINLNTSRLVFPRLDLLLITTSMSCLSSSVKARKLKGTQIREKLAKNP
jgi:hypothetical protein